MNSAVEHTNGLKCISRIICCVKLELIWISSVILSRSFCLNKLVSCLIINALDSELTCCVCYDSVDSTCLVTNSKSVNILVFPVTYINKLKNCTILILKLELSICKRLALFVYLVTNK